MKQASLVIGLVLLAVPASAQTQAKQPKTLVFLTPAQIDPGKLLAPPPEDGCDSQQKEMAEVKHLVKTRTPERYKQATWDAEHEDVTPFAAVIGPGFDLEKLPATARLLTGVLNDQSIAASTAKDYFKRKFPVAVETPASYREWTCDKDDRKPETRPLRSTPAATRLSRIQLESCSLLSFPRSRRKFSPGLPTMPTAAKCVEITTTAI